MHLTDTGVLSLQCPKKSTSGNISYHFFCVRPSHQTHLIQSCLLTEAELRDDFFFFLLLVIKKWISLHSCLSGWMQQQESPSVTCSLSCDVDGQLELEQKCTSLHIQNREEGGGLQREPESLLSAVRGWHEFKHTDTHTPSLHAVAQ